MTDNGLIDRKLHRVQRSRKKGYRLPENTICVTRGTKWGNPFPVHGSHPAAVRQYKEWLDGSLPGQEIKEAARVELRGKNLACWCTPHVPCHADVLLEIANE